MIWLDVLCLCWSGYYWFIYHWAIMKDDPAAAGLWLRRLPVGSVRAICCVSGPYVSSAVAACGLSSVWECEWNLSCHTVDWRTWGSMMRPEHLSGDSETEEWVSLWHKPSSCRLVCTLLLWCSYQGRTLESEIKHTELLFLNPFNSAWSWSFLRINSLHKII